MAHPIKDPVSSLPGLLLMIKFRVWFKLPEDVVFLSGRR